VRGRKHTSFGRSKFSGRGKAGARRRGEVYYLDLGPGFGREPGGTRVVVVVSNDQIDASSLPVTVTVTVAREETHDPLRVYGVLAPAADSGLGRDVLVDCLQLRSLDPGRFPPAAVGSLSPRMFKGVEGAIHRVVRV
jgi:mRNA-degrading endonuclease toxin of MazEF toxin-antitoxin module